MSVSNPKRVSPKDTPIQKAVGPLQKFAAHESFGGILLLIATVAALVWANSPWAHTYQAFQHLPFTIGLGKVVVSRELHFWINDGLMALFFFVMGLEIKRQFLAGALASRQRAILPIVAALGGAVVPALIYYIFNAGDAAVRGWGIPMATDIAFVLGVVALLGSRVPLGLKVFLTALAIVDDILAILVIAIFYTEDIALGAAWLAVGCFIAALASNRLGVRNPLPYALIGIVLWVAIWQLGIHATIAGVLLALVIPSRTEVNQEKFLEHSHELLKGFKAAAEKEPRDILSDVEQQQHIDALQDVCEKVQSPLHRLEEALRPWVIFVVVPLFALANAGIALPESFDQAVQPITLGIVMGLVFGKPLGITLFSWLAVKSGLAALPKRVTWRHIRGAGWLAGIGFTMSIFVADLAFADKEQLAVAKLGVFCASLWAGVIGTLTLIKSRDRAG